jgi:hypothetical protein
MLVLAYLFVTRLTYEYNNEAAAAAALKVSRQVLVTLRKLAVKNDPSERRKVAGPIQRLTDAERDWITAALPRVTRQLAEIEARSSPAKLTMGPLTSPGCRRSHVSTYGSPASDLVVVSELRRVELPAGSTADLGFGCPPVTVVVRAVQLVRGPSAAQAEE